MCEWDSETAYIPTLYKLANAWLTLIKYRTRTAVKVQELYINNNVQSTFLNVVSLRKLCKYQS